MSWSYRARELSLVQFRGSLTFAHSDYLGFRDTREELALWSTWRGWSHESWPNADLMPDDDAAIYWRSADDFGFLGLGIHTSGRQGVSVREVEIPHCLLAALPASALLLLTARARRTRRRARLRLCPACAYDLRGLPANSPCPECGGIAQADPAA